MRILLLHNYYGSVAPSGENMVFEAERFMLEKHGHEVRVYNRYSDEIRGERDERCGVMCKLLGMVKGAVCTVGNPFAATEVSKICRAFKPDVIHFHNTFPLISPLAIRAASRYAPVVLTLHNYRIACAAGVPIRDSKVCSLCLDNKCVWYGVAHRCYRGSFLATIPLALNIALYRKFLPRWVSCFLVFSKFQFERMSGYGIPCEQMRIKPNYVDMGLARKGVFKRRNQVVYVGRLSAEKGVSTLIAAWHIIGKSTKCKLILIGEGANRKEYELQAKGLDIEFLGKRSNSFVRSMIATSKAVVLPSECWEGMPITALESFAEGTPCIVSNLGALPELVNYGALGEVFVAGCAESLAKSIKHLLSRSDYDEICSSIKGEARGKYSESANYVRLMEIYNSLINAHGSDHLTRDSREL